MVDDELLGVIARTVRRGAVIGPDTPLLTSGVVDSFHLPALIAALEAHHGRRIDLAEVGADNFDTPRQIDAFLKASR